MARKKKADEWGDGAAPGKGAQVDGSNRKAIIKNAADRILSLQSEIATLREDITEIKGEVKGAGIKMADFNAALRLYKMDGDDVRNESIDNIRICFEALGIGAQGDLFPKGPAAGAPSAGNADHALH